jgi:hypothetical protein
MLSQEQIDHFNTQGFLVVENLLCDDLLQRIHTEYEAKNGPALQKLGVSK